MTRKDYENVAANIQSERVKANKMGNPETCKAWRIACEQIALNMADYLESENNRFEREQFLKACGVE